MKDVLGIVTGFLIMLVPLAALLTHIIFCIKTAAVTGSAIALLIVGLAIFPIGIFHGVSLWLGFAWI